MSDYERRQAQPAGIDREFLDGLRAADPGIVGDMAVAACRVITDHGRMKDLTYWLLNDGGLFGYGTTEATADRRERNEEELKKLAGRLEIEGDPGRIDDIIRRYEDMTPTGRNRHG